MKAVIKGHSFDSFDNALHCIHADSMYMSFTEDSASGLSAAFKRLLREMHAMGLSGKAQVTVNYKINAGFSFSPGSMNDLVPTGWVVEHEEEYRSFLNSKLRIREASSLGSFLYRRLFVGYVRHRQQRERFDEMMREYRRDNQQDPFPSLADAFEPDKHVMVEMRATRFCDFDDPDDLEKWGTPETWYEVEEAIMVFQVRDYENFVSFVEAELCSHKGQYGEHIRVHWQDVSPLYSRGDTDVLLEFAADARL